MDSTFDFFGDIWKRTELRFKFCFFGSFFTGIITHLYTLTNKLINWDELQIGGVGGGLCFGRWLSDYFHWWFSRFNSPALNGVMNIFFLALAACLVVAALDIRSMTGAVLTGMIFVTFPAVCSTMTYMFVASIYGMAVFMSALAAYITIRFRKWGWLPAIMLEVISMAVYQAYFPLTVTVFVLSLIVDVIQNRDPGNIIKAGFKYLGVLFAGMACYLASLKILDVPVADYRGMQDIGGSSAGEYIRAILRSYHRIIEYFVTSPDSYAGGMTQKYNAIAFALLVISAVLVFWGHRIYKKGLQAVLYIVLSALMPLSIALIYCMTIETQHASATMIYNYVMFYVWLIVMTERCVIDKKIMKLLPATAACVLILVNFMYFRTTANAYYRTYIGDKRVYALYNRIVDRLEEMPGFEYGDNIYISGAYEKGAMPLSTYDMDGYLYNDLDGVATENTLFMEPSRQLYIRLFLGIENSEGMPVSEERGNELKETEQYKEMPVWPDEGCVAKIEDVWMVKMTE